MLSYRTINFTDNEQTCLYYASYDGMRTVPICLLLSFVHPHVNLIAMM